MNNSIPMNIPTTPITERLTAVKGDMFSPYLATDGLAVFVPCGLTCLRVEAEEFIKSHSDSDMVVCLDRNDQNVIYPTDKVRNMVFLALNKLYAHGARRIAMNAIRTTAGAGESERLTKEAAAEWLEGKPSEDIHIYLADLRGGFNC